MGKAPSFQFYPNDWTRDLEDHPLEVEGAWIRICCKLWWSEHRGNLTRTLLQWGRILRITEDEANRIISYIDEQKIAEVKRNGNGNVTIISRRMVRDEKNREQTKLRVRAYRDKKDCNGDVTHHVTQMKQRSSSSSSSSCTKVPNNNRSLSLPDFIPMDLWFNFKDHRRKLRKPMTKKAEDLMIKKLTRFKSEGYDPVILIETMIERGWQSIELEWIQGKGTNEDEFEKFLKRHEQDGEVLGKKDHPGPD